MHGGKDGPLSTSRPSAKMMSFFIGSSPRFRHQFTSSVPAWTGSLLSGRDPFHQPTQSGAFSRNWVVPKVSGSEMRSEEHTSELQSLMRNSYAVFCLKKKNKTHILNKTVI